MRQSSPVVVKDLKAVDIQHTDDCVFPMKQRVVVFNFNDSVDVTYDPAEKSLILSLQWGKSYKEPKVVQGL